MKTEYNITGMTCTGCLSKVKEAIESIEGVESVGMQLDYPQATIESVNPPDLDSIKKAIANKGNYQIVSAPIKTTRTELSNPEALPDKSITTYKPLLLIIGFIAGVSALVQYPFEGFSGMLWMRHFMAGFFIVFAFFKLLNLEGFSNSYRMYDLVARVWKPWGYIYPFVELALGIAYLIDFGPVITNTTTAIVLGVSSIGVIQANLNKKQIKCACLGDVFNLPMSTVTIIEDVTMVGMAVFMLI